MILNFKISSTISIKICELELKYKENSYIQPTSKLHKFDFVYIFIEYKNKCTILNYDTLDIILDTFKVTIFQLLQNELLLSNEISLGDFGLAYANFEQRLMGDQYLESEYEFFSKFHFFSKKFTAAWLYCKNYKFYLEISPLYPWVTRDPYPTEEYYTFKEFKKNYISEIYELSLKQICSWIYPIVKLQQKLDLEFEKQYKKLKDKNDI